MSDKCATLHRLVNIAKRHRFPFDDKTIPENGIYILFEKGEIAHNADRIVRVGTHTGKDQLRSRLKQHFINENKDRSIFRKNIGRAILNRRKDQFLEQWEIDLTTASAKEKFGKSVDMKKQRETEREVSKYIRDNFSFVVLKIDDKNERLKLESRIISTLSACSECKASTGWLGNFSPKEKIRESGLWLVNELYKEELSDAELEVIKSLLTQ